VSNRSEQQAAAGQGRVVVEQGGEMEVSRDRNEVVRLVGTLLAVWTETRYAIFGLILHVLPAEALEIEGRNSRYGQAEESVVIVKATTY
jgi:hypothetical protein